MGLRGDGAIADYLTTPGPSMPAGLLAGEMGVWTKNLVASSTTNISASSDNGYRDPDARGLLA